MLRLMVATDGSDNAMRAIRHVCMLARRGLVIEAVLCNVQPPSDGAHAGEAEANATMAPGIATLATAGIRVLTHHATGEAAKEIARAAREWGAAAIVVGRRRGLNAGGIPGSVSLRVTREADVPVMVVS